MTDSFSSTNTPAKLEPATRLIIAMSVLLAVIGTVSRICWLPKRIELPDRAAITQGVQANVASANWFTRKEVIEKKLTDYHETIGALHANIYWQVGLALICLLLMGRFSQDIDLPVLGVKFPSGILMLLVPFLMCYLWLDLGYKLNSSVEKRLALTLCLQEHGDWPTKKEDYEKDKSGNATVNFKRGSLAPLLFDDGFLDGWFLCHWWPDYSIQGRPFNRSLFYIVYGLIFGLIHACMLVTLLGGIYETQQERKHEARVLFWVVFVTLAVSHYYFGWRTGNRNWLQPCIWAATIGGLIWLARYEMRSRAKAKKTEKRRPKAETPATVV